VRLAAVLLCLAATLAGAPPAGAAAFDVLLFTRAEGFRHDSIADGERAVRELGAANDFSVTVRDGSLPRLARFEAVVFLSTTGNVLDSAGQAALARYVRRGGGWAGVHAAADAEYGWPFYARLLAGGLFRAHPPTQRATIVVEDRRHRSTRHLRSRWTRTDEWYGFRANPRAGARVLLRLDEASYAPGDSAMGADHPIAWCRALGRGRSWYTALGHTRQSYGERAFRRHLLGGILTAAGRAPADCRPRPLPRSPRAR
jgi:type 1 glutamine amidotransferase